MAESGFGLQDTGCLGLNRGETVHPACSLPTQQGLVRLQQRREDVLIASCASTQTRSGLPPTPTKAVRNQGQAAMGESVPHRGQG